jgi:hypothetical protein
MDGRLQRVEFKPIGLLTSAQVQAAIDSEDEELTGRDAIVSLNAPNSYKRVFDGYVYSDKTNGNQSGTTVELWVEASTGAKTDDNIEVSGVRRAGGKDLEISGKFNLIELDTEPWDGRPSWRATPPSNIAESLYYRSASDAPNSWTTSRQLQTKRQISKYSATTSTVTLTMSDSHNFKAGDVISVDLEDADIRLYGIDGLFRVKEVTDNTIVYDFDVPIEEPINESTLTVDRFVYPVVREFIREGATWIQDGSEEDGDVVWVWKDYRWVNIRNYTGSDGVAPNPVTNLEATSSPNKQPGAQTGTATIKLTWDAPTKDVNNKPLKDLAGYAVWWRQSQGAEWRKEEFTGNDTVWARGGFEDGEQAFFRVYARDSGNILSDFTAVSHTPNLPFDPTVKKPSPPAVITYLGATRVSWDGKDFEEAVSSRNTFQIELHWSPTDGFTPNADTLYERFPAIPGGAYLVIPNREFGSIDDSLPDDTAQTATVYFKFVAVDVYGKPTAASTQTAANVQLNKIVKFAELDVDSFVGKSITGATYQTNNNVSTTGGIQFTKDFFVTYGPNGSGETFRINAKTGAVTIGGGLGLEALNTLNAKVNSPTDGLEVTRALAITQGGLIATAQATATSAFSQANTAILTADSLTLRTNTIEGTANNAKTTADSAKLTADGLVVRTTAVEGTANDASTRVTAITDVSAGVVTVRKGPVVSAINGTSNQTTIDGGNITTGTLNANRIGAGSIDARVISITDLSAGNVNRGTLSGRNVETGSTGGRIVLSAGNRRIDIFSGTTTQAGFLLGDSNGVLLSATNSDVYVAVRPSAVVLAASAGSNRLAFTSSGSLVVTQPSVANGGAVTLGALISGVAKSYVFADSAGRLTRGTSTVGISDLRVKNNVSPVELGLELINSLNPVIFNWEDIELGNEPHEPYKLKRQLGLIAQELKSSLESLGVEDSMSLLMPHENQEFYKEALPEENVDDEPILGIDYIQFVPILIKAIKELSARLDALET